MAAHTTEQFKFIIEQLATFESHKSIEAAFKERFPDTKCDARDIAIADPAKGLTDPVWRALFDKIRAEFLASGYAAPTSEKDVRLAMLDATARRYFENNDLGNFRATLEQIAKETSGFYEGKATSKASANGGADAPRQITEIIETIIDPVTPVSA